MWIDEIYVHRITVPFSGDFSHSRKKGASAENIVVEVVAERGAVRGYGEGAPRPYVTGESQGSAAQSVRMLVQHEAFPWELDSISQVSDFLDSLASDKRHNAAVCALELSLMDALGKRQGLNVMGCFPQNSFSNRVSYGATIPLADKQRITHVCLLIRKLGMTKLRLKMGKDLRQNQEGIETVRQVFGADCDLRVDVNGAWDHDLAWSHLPLLNESRVRVLEQPMMPGDPNLSALAEITKMSDIVLMADESACSLTEVEGIAKEGCYRMINVRLSKCGGVRNSLRIIDFLRAHGLSFQIGCQLGETGILSAAGRALCLLCPDATYYDGSYDSFLLKENITMENVSFGQGGWAGPLKEPGLGVEVNREALSRLSQGHPKMTIRRP
jgi:L-alanine-DL-glutamate epimerase-like enolase superfamily enzyme